MSPFEVIIASTMVKVVEKRREENRREEKIGESNGIEKGL